MVMWPTKGILVFASGPVCPSGDDLDIRAHKQISASPVIAWGPALCKSGTLLHYRILSKIRLQSWAAACTVR